MTTDELRIKYGKQCWFNCKDGDEAFTDGYVMWLEKKVMEQALSLGGVVGQSEQLGCRVCGGTGFIYDDYSGTGLCCCSGGAD
jgi:hypothetical protein